VTSGVAAILRLQTLALIASIRTAPLRIENRYRKGDAMKALFATLFAAMLSAMAVMTHAAPLSPSIALSTDIQAPLPADDDKDKDKDKDKKDG
jgi:hypothetical protein